MIATESKTVAITGASGMVGQALRQQIAGDWDIKSLVRSQTSSEDNIYWNPKDGQLNAADLEGVSAVVHLAGENIAEGRWNEAKKRRILDSRVQGTTLLAETLAKLEQPPSVLVSASAIGFYGDRGDETCTEDSSAGQGFLPETCVAWEEATRAAAEAGIRVVNLRIGVVLSDQGGALKAMLLPFKMGAGGKVGSGKQYWSWITLTDLVRSIAFSIDTASLNGPVNAVAPHPATNLEFTKALGSVLKRPTFMPLPAFAARIVIGEMANDLLLASARVVPNRLTDAGFEFQYPELEGALRHALGKKRPPPATHDRPR